MKKLKKYLLPFFIWCVVAGYIACAVAVSHRRLPETVVQSVEIDIADSSENRRLVTDQMVREWLLRGNVRTVGATVGEIDFAAVERLIAGNGFVADVSAYAAVNGVLYIDIRQRRPLVRIITDGYNVYSTDNGFVFSTPLASTIYVPVVTGSYRPPFPPDFNGSAAAYADERVEGCMSRIRSIEKSISDSLSRRREKAAKVKSMDREISRMKRRWYLFESESDLNDRKDGEWRRREKESDTVRMLDEYLARAETERAAERRVLKKELKERDDFAKLINFVEMIEEDDFWSAEIVQIVADLRPNGALSLELVPRSGSFRIAFGSPDGAEKKLAKLLRFYREGLSRVGWNTYSTINVGYDGLVVCRK